ncbi:SMI1/KNR4 family protein [Brevibacillus brevis]|uniref:SMI1/KNR4 family protein n=1 Tax=Brevibacillus brevis TaxID=1393 RepID=UPI001C8F0D94|nr:SMI1/KNR4 family protein [Brevibacillus brevis]MBY0084202.1 SMI1/KNR4 family protein [Brevibacillus brevis]UKK98465.1 SMI1/KNR4 family protein [Brevibacillus brevis]
MIAAIKSILQKIDEIREKKITLPPQQNAIFFNPTLNADEISLFEEQLNVKLPDDFKCFLSEIGNGGFGPGYGLIPLGTETIIDPRIPVGNPDIFDTEKDFAYVSAWNYEPLRHAIENGSSDKDKLMEYYFSVERITGAIRVCDWGGGGLSLLVVKGREYGKVWSDYRGDFGGIFPETLSDEDLGHLSFLQWYEAWLDEIVLEVSLEKRRFW